MCWKSPPSLSSEAKSCVNRESVVCYPQASPLAGVSGEGTVRPHSRPSTNQSACGQDENGTCVFEMREIARGGRRERRTGTHGMVGSDVENNEKVKESKQNDRAARIPTAGFTSLRKDEVCSESRKSD